MRKIKKVIPRWEEKVYKPADDSWGIDPDDWEILRDRVIRRDKSTCQRCDRIFDPESLTVHHIRPRDSGGTNHVVNLIALCSPCHDIVEIERLGTRAAITGDNLDPIIDIKSLADPLDWHTWVYGGRQNPAVNHQ